MAEVPCILESSSDYSVIIIIDCKLLFLFMMNSETLVIFNLFYVHFLTMALNGVVLTPSAFNDGEIMYTF